MSSTEVLGLDPHGFDGVVGATGVGSVTGELWGDADLLRASLDPTYAVHEFDDLHEFDADDDWTVTNATAGTADLISGVGGLLECDAASATADQGVQVQKKISAYALAADKDLWFEARVQVGGTTAIGIDGSQLFVGLSVLDTTLIAAGAVSASNFVGWVLDAVQQAATAGTVQFKLNSTAGSAETATGTRLLVEDAWVRLGFKVNGVTSVQPFVDGVATGALLTITDVPTGNMSVSFVCQAEAVASSDPFMFVDWYRIFQLR